MLVLWCWLCRDCCGVARAAGRSRVPKGYLDGGGKPLQISVA
jgi:hypothetical protein